MGHLGNLKGEFRDLATRLSTGSVALPEPRDPAARAAWQEILEILFTPEEAAIAARLPVKPAGLGQLAARLRMSKEELKPKLDAMAEKGVVMDYVHQKSGKLRYMLSPPVVGFFEFSMMRAEDMIPKKRMAEALEAYAHLDDTFAREAFGSSTVIGRALAHESALGEDLPDVLDWERASHLVETAEKAAVSLCYCRHMKEHLGKSCDAPLDICMSLNAGADYVLRHDFGRVVDKVEALEILQAAKGRGLVQIADNVQSRPIFICNCCGCCCGQLEAINNFGLPAVNPSGFEPVCDEGLCAGCARCSRACPISAIAMTPKRKTGQRKNDIVPEVDVETCIGCAVCVSACKKKAMGMRARPQRPFVSTTTVEKRIRMALEKGRIADLLIDAANGQPARFVNRILKALTNISPADKLLASEQVQSRFLRRIMGTIPKPAPRSHRASDSSPGR